jgi:hypothetical protein
MKGIGWALGTVYRMALHLHLIPESRLDPDLSLSHCPSHSHSHSSSQSQLAPLSLSPSGSSPSSQNPYLQYLGSERLAVNPSLKTPHCLPSPRRIAESPSRLPTNPSSSHVPTPINPSSIASEPTHPPLPTFAPSTSKTNQKSCPVLSCPWQFLAQCLLTL